MHPDQVNLALVLNPCPYCKDRPTLPNIEIGPFVTLQCPQCAFAVEAGRFGKAVDLWNEPPKHTKTASNKETPPKRIDDFEEMTKGKFPNLYQVGLAWEWFKEVESEYKEKIDQKSTRNDNTVAHYVAYVHLRIVAEDLWDEGEGFLWLLEHYIARSTSGMDTFLSSDVKTIIARELQSLKTRLVST